MLLQAGSQPQHFGFLFAAEGHHLSHPGAGAGQGAGLVKDDGVGGGHGLQELAALDGDVGPSRLPHGREDGQRHGQFQGAGEVHPSAPTRARATFRVRAKLSRLPAKV